jgi:REP-associated tyrosine transposase
MPFDCGFQPGSALHLVQRGRERAACFAGEGDRLAYLELLRRALERFECALHAYALMGNHVHFLVTPVRAGSAEALMRALGERYARQLAEAQGGEAPGWDEPTVSPPLYSRRQVLACMRYIELNPVRGGIVRRPEDFRWSSYRANALGHADPLLTPHGAYCALGRSAESRCAAYQASFASGARLARRTAFATPDG